MERNLHSGHLRTLTRKQPTTSSDQDPFNVEYLELSEGYSRDGGAKALAAAVVTDIEGGRPGGIQDIGPAGLEVKEDELIQRPAIMKTCGS